MDTNGTGVNWLKRAQRWLLPLAAAATIGFVAVTLVNAQSPEEDEQSVSEQTVTESQSEQEELVGKGKPKDGFGHRGKHDRSERVDELAELVGTDSDSLRTALKGGQTLAEVAEANGVEAQTVIDSLAAWANERIDAALEAGKLADEEAASKRAEVVDRVTEFVNQTHMRNGNVAGKHGHREKLGELAALVGADARSLREALGEGQTLAEVAAEHGIEAQTVIDALVASANERIDEAVAAGKLTDSEADAKRAELETQIRSFVYDGKDDSDSSDRRGGRKGRGVSWG